MQVEIGSVYEGTVTGLTNFGAFIKLENGATGMVHISEVAAEYVSDISQYLTVGDTVKVKAIDINEKGKVSLSIKQTLPEPEKPKPSKPKTQSQNKNFSSAPRAPRTAPAREQTGPQSFEDMMARFKAQSDEKISDLKRNANNKRGSGNHRHGGKN